MKLLLALVSGAIFSFGLILSGMSNPQVVLAFLDPFGDWNPALAMVMIGAIGVTLPGYRWLRGRTAPLAEADFSWPTATIIDSKLLLGAVLFGVGWGLVGLCPGPALVAVAAYPATVLPFFVAMLIGLMAPKLFSRQ